MLKQRLAVSDTLTREIEDLKKMLGEVDEKVVE